MSDNLRIWNAVQATDPKHTKKVEFGRKFTSIDAHWQIQQATKQFGPVGEKWGYDVAHSIHVITETLILAVADVSIWQGERSTYYGPIRATCEMYGPKTKFGKPVVPLEFVCDEDAPKKAMTDALTKGLSHLGFSADVFLGLFDDNRYVQKMEREFAAEAKADVERLAPKDAARDPQSGELLSTYSAEVAKRAKKWADDAITTISGAGNTQEAIAWARAADEVPPGKKKSPLQWLEDNAVDQFVRVNSAYTNMTGEGLRQ